LGPADAFGTLASHYRNPIFGLAYRFTHDREEANDVTQTALMRAYRPLK
jgi:DNA-directed RNA polymerase specialized sigma24 family protein